MKQRFWNVRPIVLLHHLFLQSKPLYHIGNHLQLSMVFPLSFRMATRGEAALLPVLQYASRRKSSLMGRFKDTFGVGNNTT